MNREWVVVSYGGASDEGGVERVVRYLCRILGEFGSVHVLDTRALYAAWPWARLLCGGRTRLLVFGPWVFSIYLWMWGGRKQVFSNGFFACFYPCDYVVFHGTMAGWSRAVRHVVPRRVSPVRTLLMLYERCAAWTARRLIAVSREVAREICRYYQRATSVTVIPNAVDVEHFTLIPRIRKPSQPVQVLFVGRLEPRKGISFLRAVAEEMGRAAGWRLTVVAPQLVSSSPFRKMPHVLVVSRVRYNDMPAMYHVSDVLVLPTYYEGFEMVTLEALSCGVPVAGRDVGGVRALREEGCPGIALLPEKATAALDTLKELADAFASQAQKQRLRDFVKNKYSLQLYAQKWRTIIEM